MPMLNDKNRLKMIDNWFIKNNHKNGSTRNVLKIVGIYHCISMCVSIFVLFAAYVGIMSYLFRMGLLLFPFLASAIFYVCIICKTSRLAVIDDVFLIHWESKRHAWMQLLLCFLWSIQVVMRQFIDKVLVTSIFYPLSILTIYYMSYVSTFAIYNKLVAFPVAKESKKERPVSVKLQLASIQVQQALHSAVVQKPESLKSRYITLEMILRMEESLHLFMIHLSKEYSMECLLSLIEITQYQQYCLKEMSMSNDLDRDNNKYDHGLISFPYIVPLSAILENEKTDFKRKAYEIYNKYIKIGSEFEINISWDSRVLFRNMFDDEEFFTNNAKIKMMDVFLLFDEARLQMMRLLINSLSRLKQQPEYDTIKALFKLY